jgi:hypothetical protein
MYTPDRKIFGQTFIRDFTEHPVLRIGSDTWTRADLQRAGVFQMRACSILSGMAKDLGAKSLKHFHASTSPYSFADFKAGVHTLYVLFAVFQDRGLSVAGWYAAGEKKAVVTFLALKQRELKARAREREDTARRKRSRMRRSHESQVAQHMGAH